MASNKATTLADKIKELRAEKRIGIRELGRMVARPNSNARAHAVGSKGKG